MTLVSPKADYWVNFVGSSSEETTGLVGSNDNEALMMIAEYQQTVLNLYNTPLTNAREAQIVTEEAYKLKMAAKKSE